jgi:squalene-hopene/tetraprenyl-beta-curcumene cyclase
MLGSIEVRAVALLDQAHEMGATSALNRACEHLLARQHADGWWKGALDTNVTMDAEDLLLREFLGIRSARETDEAATWIRSQQNPDGSWSVFHGADGDLSTTLEAYVALRLAGDLPDQDHMATAAAFVRSRGGLQKARVFTQIWMAMFGSWSWDQVPALPPEIMLLPPDAPLNPYDFASWARQTVVALTVVLHYRPQQALPFSIEELHGPEPWAPPPATNLLGEAFLTVDRVLHVYQRSPLKPLRRLALARAERFIIERQESDGGWGGIQPPWVYSLLALHLRGYALDHPLMVRGLTGLDTFLLRENGVRRLEACQSPVWDTALSLIALADAGYDASDPAVSRAAQWLVSKQIHTRGDWAVKRPDLVPGGWAFEFENDNYPDIDDTAEVILALKKVGHRAEEAIHRGLNWMVGMQSSDGGWGAFDADNCRWLVRDLPFCDFGEVIDPPSADVTAHAVETLAELGHANPRGLAWLLASQEADGSWFGRWGVNYVYGTGAAVPALVAAGISPADPAIRRAVRWLELHQNDDGGWGEDCRSYDDPAWAGRGISTPSQTAWALLALHGAGETGTSVRDGVQFLIDTQRSDGGWDEEPFTGTGFPSDFYINYEMYRLVFPIMALARCAG